MSIYVFWNVMLHRWICVFPHIKGICHLRLHLEHWRRRQHNLRNISNHFSSCAVSLPRIYKS